MNGVGYTPIYRILKGGLDITDHFNDRTTQIKVSLSSGNGNPDTFRVSVDDRDFVVARPHVGSQLQIYLGYKETGLAYMGLYEINEVVFDGPPKGITITGLAAGMDNILKAPEINVYENKTVGDIVGELAQKGGLSPVIGGELAGKKIPFKNQSGISGYHLLHELERHFNAVGKVQDGKLLFVPRDEGQSGSGLSLGRVMMRPESFAEWSVKHTQRADFSSVKTSWWDKDQHKTIWENFQVPGGESEDAPYRVNRRFNSKDEAIEYGKSRAAALNRSKGELRATLAKGDPRVRDQMPVVVSGMRDGVDGSYVIDTVDHTYTKQNGIVTTFLAKPPGDGDDFADQRGTPQRDIEPGFWGDAGDLVPGGPDQSR